MSVPRTAMVLAAGLGTRMRPLSDDRPKSLVRVAGRPLVDHALDRLAASGVERAIVNVHAFADQLEAHLRNRQGAPSLLVSNERDRLLDTGGAIKRARALLGEDPLLVSNTDTVWIETGAPALDRLAAGWDDARMDARLLLTPTHEAIGFDGPGDFFMDEEGRLTPRREAGSAARAPYVYMGVHIARPEPIYQHPQEAFGLFPLWVEMARRGRLFGALLEGQWMHVGDPSAVVAAEIRLAGSSGR